MQSEWMTAGPQFICSYAWKVPPERPAIFERAQLLTSKVWENYERNASPAEHPSITWKAYLASREFQHLASDLAEAIFKAAPAAQIPGAARPASLTMDPHALAGAGAEPPHGLLAPALPAGARTRLRQREAGQHVLAAAA